MSLVLCALGVGACGSPPPPSDGGGDGGAGDGGGDAAITVTPIMGTWRPVMSGTSDDIYAVWGSGASDVWAAAARSYLHSANGTSWTATMSDYALRGVTGTGPDDVWLYGLTIPANGSGETGHPVFFHKTTGAMLAMSMPASVTNSQFYWLWARAPNDIWAAGTGTPNVAHYDGTNWTGMTTGVMAADTLYGVYGFGANDVWAVGQHVYRWNGTSWAQQMLPGVTMMEYSFGVWGSAPDSVWVVGAHVYAQRWAGSSWAEADTHLDSTLNAIWGAAANDVWAVGDGGVIVHWNGRDWEDGHVPMGMTQTLRAIWGSSASDIWAVGERGTLLHYTVP